MHILSITREEEHSKLLADLENQQKVAPRKSYTHRIEEITKNSRKQDADIERILKETREVQLESNSIQESLHRTYAVADEIVFRYESFSCIYNINEETMKHLVLVEILLLFSFYG